ncbi:unnamed protein product [Ceratitis capitata]|uniref:(Mediterranean fruit fly) hypothetical protein n=1 Tax=Ceratitis capitata TaxID=7213 RepID=A0A811UQY1_CERCA|nr:unnamed protein product [Ceratitis capitata]
MTSLGKRKNGQSHKASKKHTFDVLEVDEMEFPPLTQLEVNIQNEDQNRNFTKTEYSEFQKKFCTKNQVLLNKTLPNGQRTPPAILKPEYHKNKVSELEKIIYEL